MMRTNFIENKSIISFFILITLLFSCAPQASFKGYNLSESYSEIKKTKKSRLDVEDYGVYKRKEKIKEKIIKYPSTKKRKYSHRTGNISLHFDNITLDQLLKNLTFEILGFSYVSSVNLNQKISIHLENASEQEILLTLKEILLSLGYFVILDYDRKLIKIFKNDKELPVSESFRVVVYEPKYVEAEEILKLIKEFDFKGIKIGKVGNKIILIGPSQTVQFVYSSIIQLDTIFKGNKYIAFIKTSINPDKVKEYIEKILSLLGYKKKKGIVESLPDVGILAIVTNDKFLLDEIKDWVKIIEESREVSKEKLYILKLNYLEAEKVAEFLNKLDVLKVIQIKADGASDVSQLQKAALSRILNVTKTEMIQEQGKENSKQPQIDSPNDKLLYSYSEKTKEKRIQRGRIIADTTTNTLIIRATPLQYKVIESLIKKLDKTPTQVFIEMVVAEVSVGDSLNYGLEALFKGFLDKYPFSIETSFGLKQNSPRLSGFKAIIFGKNADIRGILNFLASKTNLRVLSAPYVLVKNLEEAKVEIGAEVPIVSELMTSVSNGTPVITTAIQYRSTGIILKVKPIISADGTITLKIEEEVSDAIPNTLSPEVQSPIITKRSATTTLVLKSGQIALLGGILQHRFEANKKGIPVISDIPGLGYLFKSESKSTSKTELIILIRAYIIQDLSEISRFRDETINKLEDLKNLIKIIKEKGKEK